MSISKTGETTINIRQGDSGELIFSGFNPEKNYNVYFAVRDEDRNLMFPEVSVTTNGKSSVTIPLEAEDTKQLIVPAGEDTAIYYWGIKYSEAGSGEEYTIYPEMFQKCIMLVCPQYVEGPV